MFIRKFIDFANRYFSNNTYSNNNKYTIIYTDMSQLYHIFK